MSNENKTCPLNNSRTFNYCTGQCAWYNNETGNCVLVDISMSLAGMRNKPPVEKSLHPPILSNEDGKLTSSDSQQRNWK